MNINSTKEKHTGINIGNKILNIITILTFILYLCVINNIKVIKYVDVNKCLPKFSILFSITLFLIIANMVYVAFSRIKTIVLIIITLIMIIGSYCLYLINGYTFLATLIISIIIYIVIMKGNR